jgi:chromosome segregation ATPase
MTAGSSSFFAGGVNGNAGNGNGGGALSRANSQSSLCSEIHEPSWFSHAFDSGSHCAETLRLARRVEGVVGVVPPPPGVEDVDDMSMSLVGMEVSMTDVGADDDDASEIEDEAAATDDAGEGEGGGPCGGGVGAPRHDDEDDTDDDTSRRISSKAHMIDMMKMRAKSKSFHGSVSSEMNKTKKEMTTKSSCSRSRSFHGGGGDSINDGGIGGRGATPSRRSRSQIRRGTNDENEDQRRERERSLSIVRDARSFIESIGDDDEVDGHGDVVSRRQPREKGEMDGRKEGKAERYVETTVVVSQSCVKEMEGWNRKEGERIETKCVAVAQSYEREIEEWKGKVERMEIERVAVAQSHERAIEEWRGKAERMETERVAVTQSHERAIDGWKGKVARMEAKCAEMERELERRKMTVVEMEGARSEAEDDLREALVKLSELESSHGVQLSQLQCGYESMTMAADEWKGKYDRMERQNRELLDENDKCQSDYERMTRVVDEWKGRHDQMERQHRELLDESDKCQRSIVTESTKKSDGSSSVNDELVDQISDLAEENFRLSSRCRELEKDVQYTSSHAQDLGGLVERIGILEDDNHQLSSRCQKLEQKLECASRRTQDMGGVVERIGILDDENGRLSSRCRELERGLQDLERDLESSRVNITDANATIESLRIENRDLRAKAKELVRNLRRCFLLAAKNEEGVNMLGMISDAQAENGTFHELMEAAIRLVGEVTDKISTFIESHDISVNEYDAEFAALNEDLNQEISSNDELSRQMDALMKDNKQLIQELEEANTLVVSSVRNEIKQEQLSKETWNREKRDLVTAIDGLRKENEKLQASLNSLSASIRNELENELIPEREANARLKEMVGGASAGREEAYDTCKVLQDEIYQLRLSLEESRGRVRELQRSDASVSSSNAEKEKLAEIVKANESLTKELEQKTSTLQAVQSVLGGLKEEQVNIRETIEMLRAENTKLRGMQPTPPLPNPPPPPPPPRKPTTPSLDASDRSSSHPKTSHSSSGGSDSSQSFKLEARIRNIEKENTGLRDANATLSAKLFDEMERTDALRVANEGLATRICKLVAFIQQKVDSPAAGGSKSKRGKNGFIP